MCYSSKTHVNLHLTSNIFLQITYDRLTNFSNTNECLACYKIYVWRRTKKKTTFYEPYLFTINPPHSFQIPNKLKPSYFLKCDLHKSVFHTSFLNRFSQIKKKNKLKYNVLIIYRRVITNQVYVYFSNSNRYFSGLYGRARRNTSSVLNTNVGVHVNPPFFIKPFINSKHSRMCKYVI